MTIAIAFDDWPGRDAWIIATMTRYRAAAACIPEPRPVPDSMRAALFDAFGSRRPFCFMRGVGNVERVALARAWEAQSAAGSAAREMFNLFVSELEFS